jgi:Transposase Tn5 dimerisation domain
MVRWIGELGGFLGRKSDGEPGVKVLWRGFIRLQDIVDTWRIFNPPHTYG